MTLNERILHAIASGALLSATFGCQPNAIPDEDRSEDTLKPQKQLIKPADPDPNLGEQDLYDNDPQSPPLEVPKCGQTYTDEEIQTALSGEAVKKGGVILICEATCSELRLFSSDFNGGYEQVCAPWEVSDGCCHTQAYQERRHYRGRPFMVEGVARTSRLQETHIWASQLTLESDLTPEQRQMVVEAWSKAGAEEHASIASFAQFLLDLMSLGAPPSLIQQTAQAINDEVLHAQACFGIASAISGTPVGPGSLDVVQPQAARTPEDILRAAIREGCIGETLAAHLAGWLAPKAADPTVRGVLAGIAKDEGEHAALAWEFVAWMLASKPELRWVVVEEYEALNLSDAVAESEAGELLGWGVADTSEEMHLSNRAVVEVLSPAFQALLA